jgi:hypothetical protein
MRDDITPTTCRSCRGRGLIRPGDICPVCEGDGRLLLLEAPVKVLDVRDVGPFEGECRRRLAVLFSEEHGARSVIHAVTDCGASVVVDVDTTVLANARTIVLVETARRTP